MKFKTVSIVILFLIVFMCGCSKKIENQDNYSVPKEYKNVLSDYEKLLEFRFSENFWKEYETGNYSVSLNDKLEADLKKEFTSLDGETHLLSYNTGDGSMCGQEASK